MQITITIPESLESKPSKLLTLNPWDNNEIFISIENSKNNNVERMRVNLSELRQALAKIAL